METRFQLNLQARRTILMTAVGLGGILLAIHSIFALATFIHVYSNRGIAQAELAWAVFFEIDYPTAQLVLHCFGSTAPMRAVFDIGYDLVGSGPNLRAFVMIAVAGGLHWFLIGSALGGCFACIRARYRSRLGSAHTGNNRIKEDRF